MDPDFAFPYTLGIDIGTSSVKIAIVDGKGTVVENVTTPSFATLESEVGEVGSEQSPQEIWSVIQSGMRQLLPSNQVKIQAIGISGQMHGVVLWQHKQGWHRLDDQTRHIVLGNVSPLYTWQDRRCTPDFLASLPKPDSHLKVSTGYGCATLYWLLRNKADYLAERKFDCVGTIMDFAVAAICDLEKPVTSDQLAASMGFFNVGTGQWNTDILQSSGFPVSMLPEVKQAGEVVGHLQQGLEHVPAGTPVLVAMGDMQCGVMSAVQSPVDATLNISTSIQLSMIVEDYAQGVKLAQNTVAMELVPFFEDKYLAVVAGLNGGNVISCLVALVKKWMQELGIEETLPDKLLWEKLLSLGQASAPTSTLKILPTLFGERHNTNLYGQMVGIGPDTATLGAIFRATSEGIVDNIFQLMTPELLAAYGVKRVITSGSVLFQNLLVRERVEKVLSGWLEVHAGSESDSAFGAAKVALLCFSDSS